MRSFILYAEQRDKEENYKNAVFTTLGINPDDAESRMDDELGSFANRSELEKMSILDELPPDVKGSVIAAINEDDTKVRELIAIMTRESEAPPASSDVGPMQPELPDQAFGGSGGPAPSSPM